MKRTGIARLLLGLLLVVAFVLGDWLVVGDFRAESLARSYLESRETSSTLSNVRIVGSGPWLPPFWSVEVAGDVTEPGRTTPSYTAYMWLLVEPVTGIVIFNGAG